MVSSTPEATTGPSTRSVRADNGRTVGVLFSVLSLLVHLSKAYDKLVRDRIPEIIERNGERPVTHVAVGDEYEQRLAEKLDEEVAEFHESGDTAELADVLEVAYALADSVRVSRDELERIRAEKADDRGGFDEGIVLERVE